jgi:DNA polymerase elongation subunit (family B)
MDVLIYMSKSMYNLPSYKLGDVATAFGVTPKLQMPDMRAVVESSTLREYNMNDCVVVLDIWNKENMGEAFPSIAVCTAFPVYDCCRYVTGTLAVQVYSSYILSQCTRVSWTQTGARGKYKGGYVMEPRKGYHEDIVVCDFESMYPSIMSTCRINPHDFSEDRTPFKEEVYTVEATASHTTVCLESKRVTYDSTRQSHLSDLASMMVEERKRVRKTNPVYGRSLKIAANSVYGALGYEHSPLFSPSCAASITAIGRHCIRRSREIFEACGLVVVYGDTDSCMVTRRGGRDAVCAAVKDSLEGIHSYLSGCSLNGMSMVLEEYYPRGIMLDKKRYCLLKEDGSIKYVGISVARKDVMRICQTAAEVTVSSILKHGPIRCTPYCKCFLHP